MPFSRRSFVKMGSVVSLGGVLAPNFVARTMTATAAGRPRAFASAKPNTVSGSKALVIIQLSGGNDGLNTVVPYADAQYYAKRTGLSDSSLDIAIPADKVLTLNDHIGLNPAMPEMKAFYDAGNLAVVQGVGYPNPDYSHFRAMEIWQTAAPDKIGYGVGWIGRYLDSLPSGQRQAAKAHITKVMIDDARRAPLETRKPTYAGDIAYNRQIARTIQHSTGKSAKTSPAACTPLSDITGGAVGLTYDLSEALWASKTIVPSIVNFGDFRFYSDSEFDDAEAAARLSAANDIYALGAALSDQPEIAYVGQSAIDALDISAKLNAAGGDNMKTNIHYYDPANNLDLTGSYLAYQLFHLGEMLKADLDFRIFYLSTGGFDTHDHQKNDQANLLADLSISLKAFWDDMSDCGLDKHVAVMTFSEFGRRVEQNASGGTDHGSAEPMFILADSSNLVGSQPTDHIVGKTPDLTTDIYPDSEYDSGNIIPQIDFRSVYATVMQNWLGVQDAGTLADIIQHSADPASFVGARTMEPPQMAVPSGIFS